MTIVLITPFEAMRIASGNAMNCTTTSGEDVEVRLFTAAELLAAHRRACASIGADPSMTRKQAADLVRQL